LWERIERNGERGKRKAGFEVRGSRGTAMVQGWVSPGIRYPNVGKPIPVLARNRRVIPADTGNRNVLWRD
jgi:hypothetical protein